MIRSSFDSNVVELWNIGSSVNETELSFDGFVEGTLHCLHNTVSVRESHYLVRKTSRAMATLCPALRVRHFAVLLGAPSL